MYAAALPAAPPPAGPRRGSNGSAPSGLPHPTPQRACWPHPAAALAACVPAARHAGWRAARAPAPTAVQCRQLPAAPACHAQAVPSLPTRVGWRWCVPGVRWAAAPCCAARDFRALVGCVAPAPAKDAAARCAHPPRMPAPAALANERGPWPQGRQLPRAPESRWEQLRCANWQAQPARALAGSARRSVLARGAKLQIANGPSSPALARSRGHQRLSMRRNCLPTLESSVAGACGNGQSSQRCGALQAAAPPRAGLAAQAAARSQ